MVEKSPTPLKPRMYDETIAPRTKAASPKGQKRQLSLTIVYHPDPTRIGTSLTLDASSKPTAVSRIEARFGADDARPSAIGVPGVSRRPVLFESTRSGWRITPPDAAGYEIDGQAGPADLTDAALEHGVLLNLAGWVLLWVRTGPAVTDRNGLGLVGCSRGMGEIRKQIRQVAPSSVPVLIIGPSGAGKELVARAVHDVSRRSRQPFLAINLAAVAGSAAVSQLFGHTRGAFTGADRNHRGYFQQANLSTLFIDEIGEVQDEVQPLLLRALESGEIQPLGGNPTQVDVRLVFATDANLQALVGAGVFRKALYYRMAQLIVPLPPLVERPEDIALQTVHFLRMALDEHDQHADLLAPERMWLTPEFMEKLLGYRWPGNSRELRGLLQRALLQSASLDQIGLSNEEAAFRNPTLDTPATSTPQAPASPRSDRRSSGSEPTREQLLEELQKHGFKVNPAIEAFAIGRTRFYGLLKKHQIPTAKELEAPAIREALAAANGDVVQTATALQVSLHGLRLRMGALGIIAPLTPSGEALP